MTAWLASLGFDAARMGFAARTAVAACLAFVLAWALGLEHPQWSAMTVWAASQPTRGQLWEKSLFRLLGSIGGTGVGVLLVLAMQVHPVFLVLGLAFWVGACTYLGNVLRGFVAYGTVLAGYTAAMVSLLDAAHPDQVLALGTDRLATVLTGVAVATLIGSLLSPKTVSGDLRASVQRLLVDMLRQAAQAAPSQQNKRSLLAELARIEEGLDPHGAGSLRSRQNIRQTRALLIAATPLLLWKHGPRQPEGFLDGLTTAANALDANDIAAATEALRKSAEISTLSPRLHDTLIAVAEALLHWSKLTPEDRTRPAPRPLVILHRDWVGAREAALRAFGALLFFGAIWIVTGWHAGPFMLLGLSVMLSLFSSFENPSQMMKSVFFGQLLGVCGALALRWLVWPLAESEVQMILFTLPFILIGPLFVGHRRTVALSFDYNMVLMLMSQPHWPLSGDFGTSVTMGMAVLAAPLAAMGAYLTIYPANLKRRIDTVMRAMLRDLQDLSQDPKAREERQHWQARLYHRTLRLVQLSGRSNRAQYEALDAALAVLNLGHTAMWCHRVAQDPRQTDSDRRAARLTLTRLSRLEEQPEDASLTLSRLARRAAPPEAALIREAIEGLATLSPALVAPQ